MTKLEIWEAIRKPYIDELYDSPHFDNPVNKILDFLDEVKPMKKQQTKGVMKIAFKTMDELDEIRDLLENRKTPYLKKRDLKIVRGFLIDIKGFLINAQNKV